MYFERGADGMCVSKIMIKYTHNLKAGFAIN